MGSRVKPGLTVLAEAVLRHAIDVVAAGKDRQDDCRNDDRLCHKTLEDEDREEVFVAAEAARVDPDRVVQDSDPYHSRDAEPFRYRNRHAAKRQRKPANSRQNDQYKDSLRKLIILGDTPAEYRHTSSLEVCDALPMVSGLGAQVSSPDAPRSCPWMPGSAATSSP